MEQIAIFDVLRRHVSMIITLCVIAALAGYTLSFLITNRYAASALVLVRPQQPIKMDARTADKEFLDFPMGQSTIIETPSKTYIEIIKSPALIGKVVRKLDLDIMTKAESNSISELLPYLIAILTYGSPIQDDPFSNAVKQLQGNLSLKATEDTYLFEIKYTAKDPQLAADVTNATASLFIEFMEAIRLSEGRYLHDHLQAQLKQSRQQLDSARERLENYKKAHSVFLYEPEYDARLKVLSDLQIELAKAEGALVGGQSTLSAVSLAAKRARLSRSLREREAELIPLPGIERELKQLDLDVKEALIAYEIVDKEFKEADIKYSYAMPEVHLVSQAVAPHLPSSPIRVKIALVSLVGGLIVAIGLAFFLEFLNRRVRGIHDVEERVGVKVLATIPRVSRRRWRHAALP
jgi:uncharacterized protein involved in exopolysaccharide biosynthesis